MNWLGADAVGLPGYAAMFVGFLLFLIAMLAARRRVRRAGTAPRSQTARSTLVWIVAQGIGIGMVGFGPVRMSLDPLSAAALAEAALVFALMLGGVVLFDASSRAMGKNWAVMAQTRADQTLVENGPFAYVRNPIYLALFLFMLAMAVALGHARNLPFAIPVYAVATWMRVRREEQLLRNQFGAAYDDYCVRVKRFVPGVF